MAEVIMDLRLLTVPFTNDYKHTPWFETELQRRKYFQTKAKYTRTDFNFQKKDKVIRYPVHYDELVESGVNYVYYYKVGGNNKEYFAFITKMEYVNEGMTLIHIQTDVMQTWMFDYTVNPSFVEREHAKIDTIGANLVEENLQLGDYICNKYNKAGYSGTSSEMLIVICATQDYQGNQVQGGFYDNLYSGVKYYVARHTPEGANVVNDFLGRYDSAGAGEAIQAMFLCPEKLLWYVADRLPINVIGEIGQNTTVNKYYINSSGDNGPSTSLTLTNNLLDSYNPRNKKLLTFPYRYLLASNNNGASVVYHYEKFKTNGTPLNPQFEVSGCLTPGCSIRMIPLFYKGITHNHEEGINLGKFPALNWNSDYYTNWLTQNAVNIGVGLASSAFNLVGGIATGQAGTALGGVTSIGSTLGEMYKAELTPPQSKGNINNGDVITVSGQNDFHFYDMSIRQEAAEIIDGYFDMFGYKTNKLKVPFTNHRKSYWFTKTIDVNISGNLPMDDLATIKQCYNNGITFWRDTANLGNYSLDNSIL